MKRNFARRVRIITTVFVSSLLVQSCSSLWSHRDNKVAPDRVDAEGKSMSVPREQYEELARKYQELLNQAKVKLTDGKDVSESKESSSAPVDNQLRPEIAKTTHLDPSDLVNHIDQTIHDQKAIEGVELNPNENKMANKNEAQVGPAVPESLGVQEVNNTDEIDDQIVKMREVMNLVKVNKFDNALAILKELENSKEKQIVVRAKMMLGDLLYGQGEYDLAMQVYEEVVKKYAFSGFVIKALGKLVACSEKLKLPEKQAKYYSYLHDFFEAA